MLVNGDVLVVKKSVMGVLNEGDIVKVVEANENGFIRFAFGDDFMHMGIMTPDEFENHFEKIEEKNAPAVAVERIEELLENAEFSISTVFDKCTVVACRLPNGFVIVESSACVSPDNYNEDMGFEICLEKIENKLWELEGYRLQEEIYRQRNNCNENAYCNENECPDDSCEDCDGCDDCDYCKEYDFLVGDMY